MKIYDVLLFEASSFLSRLSVTWLINQINNCILMFPFLKRFHTIIKLNDMFSFHFINGKVCTEPSTIPDKIFGTKWSNLVKLDRKIKV